MTVPAGEYRIGTLTLAFDDPGGGPRWSFIFSDDGGTREYKWYRVEKDRALEIDPVGQLVLQTGVEDRSKTVTSGDDISLQPKLYTGGGLLINTCFRGSPTTPGGHDGQGADIKLTGGTRDQVARSGLLRLCLRHVLPGLGPSAPVPARRSARPPRRLRFRPPRRHPPRLDDG